MEFIFIAWLAFIIMSGYIASQKNRSAFLWCILGLFFGIFALVAIIAVPEKKAA